MRRKWITALNGWGVSEETSGFGLLGYFAGAPFVFAAVTPMVAFSAETVLAAFVLTTLAAFTVHLPVAAAVLGAGSADAGDAALSRRAYTGLLSAWTATLWIAAAFSA